jgi:hypothetical protein
MSPDNGSILEKRVQDVGNRADADIIVDGRILDDAEWSECGMVGDAVGGKDADIGASSQFSPIPPSPKL